MFTHLTIRFITPTTRRLSKITSTRDSSVSPCQPLVLGGIYIKARTLLPGKSYRLPNGQGLSEHQLLFRRGSDPTLWWAISSGAHFALGRIHLGASLSPGEILLLSKYVSQGTAPSGTTPRGTSTTVRFSGDFSTGRNVIGCRHRETRSTCCLI